MSDDPQDQAEALDEERIEVDDDVDGDLVGEALADYPPDHPLGVGTVGVTPAEEDAGESFAERTWREEPERSLDGPEARAVGQLVDESAATEDHEEHLVADAEPDVGGLSAEEAAMHIEDD